MAYCGKCGTEVPDGTKFCPKCGAEIGGEQPVVKGDGGHGLAIGSLVCGIVSIVLWFFGWSCIGSIALGIIGIVLASVAKKNGNTEGIRTAGFVVSIIGLVVGAIVMIYLIIVAVAFSQAVNAGYGFLKDMVN